MTNEILSQYDQERNLYTSFTSKVGDLILEILRENNVHVHSVTHRVKERKSLNKKISRPDSPYTKLSDVTDIAGVRITTYLEDDVNVVAKLLEQEFSVDDANSGDKGALLDPDRFGYLSLHHVVSLLPERCRLIEYRRFPTLKAEIQTRSILQHAWAEIEHDLGYKTTQEIPRSIRRRFSRLAGLLELADQEFISIKNELTAYETDVPERIEATPQLVGIDKASLTAFLRNSTIVRKLDITIAAFCGARIDFDDEIIANHVIRLKLLNIETIRELEMSLLEQSRLVIAFAEQWLTGTKHDFLNTGISIFYLGYALIAQSEDASRIRQYLMSVGLTAHLEQTLQRVIKTYETLREP